MNPFEAVRDVVALCGVLAGGFAWRRMAPAVAPLHSLEAAAKDLATVRDGALAQGRAEAGIIMHALATRGALDADELARMAPSNTSDVLNLLVGMGLIQVVVATRPEGPYRASNGERVVVRYRLTETPGYQFKDETDSTKEATR